MRKVLKVSFSPIAGMKLRIVSANIRKLSRIRAKKRFTGRASPVLINTNNTNKSYNRSYTNSTYSTYNISKNRTNRSTTITINISQNPYRIKSYSTYTSIYNAVYTYNRDLLGSYGTFDFLVSTTILKSLLNSIGLY